MTVKTPIKATFTGSDVTGLAEFQSADFIGVIDGGTGAVTLTSNSILLGNGTDAIQSPPIQISGSTISVSDSTTITIDEGLSVTGTITSGNLLPPTDNTGVVGNNSFTWNNGQFTDLTVDDVLTVRTAIDLADGDVLRFGDNDDFKIYHDGTANRFDLITRDLTIRDDTTTRFTFGRTTGNLTTTGDITVGGNLTVNGTTTTVNSTTIEITNSFTFEGSTADDFETTLGVIDPTADRAINLPNVSGTIITTGNISDITGLSNSQLSNPSFTIVDDSSTTSTISLGESLLLAGGTGITSVISGDSITFNIDSTVTTLTGTQTLTNKTLTTPIISSISNSGTLTLPTSTDTLIGRATTDTLTNKTLTSPKINEDVVVTATATELNFTDGVTSNIQTQLNGKASTAFAIAQAVALG
jgi:hypothetical protein